jgi:DNA-binding response OmpR family regulator
MASIFILENNEDISFVLDAWFTRKGYEVKCFTTSDKIFDEVNHFVPDVVLLDLRLPEPVMDGYLVCQKLKGEYNYPNKVFLMSGVPHTKDTLEKNCIDGFIEKPFYLKEVFEVIDAAVNN